MAARIDQVFTADSALIGASIYRGDQYSIVVTDDSGSFVSLNGSDAISAIGGRDLRSDRPFKGIYTSTADSLVVSPLTTLVQRTANLSMENDFEAAKSLIKGVLGIPDTFDFNKENSLSLLESGESSLALQIAKVAQQISVICQLGSSGDPFLGLRIYDEIASMAKSSVVEQDVFDLTDRISILTILEIDGVIAPPSRVDLVHAAITEIHATNSLENLAIVSDRWVSNLDNESYAAMRFWYSDNPDWRFMSGVHLRFERQDANSVDLEISPESSVDLSSITPGTYRVFAEELDVSPSINISDAVTVLKDIVGLSSLTGFAAIAADVNSDGLVNISDAVSILKIIVGLEEAENLVVLDGAGQSEIVFDGVSNYDLFGVILGDVDGSGAILL